MSVGDIDAAIERFASRLNYRVIDRTDVSAETAMLLDAPRIVGARQAVLRPASGRKTDVRLIESPSPSSPPLMASIGWTALEICVEDVHKTHQQMREGPFEVIGPPSAIAGLPTIHPMQVEGPDGEVIFLTQILTEDPKQGLPVALAPIDTLFIVVLACCDLAATARWVEANLAAGVSPPIAIPYRTLSRAFGLPPEYRHTIATATANGHIFLELDQYPDTAVERGRSPQGLTRGVGMVTLLHPSLDEISAPWRVPPAQRDGPISEGRRSGVIATPEGALIELLEDRS